MFITFEGIEGSGKTTQIHLLHDHLKQMGRQVVVSKEPGGTPIGLKLRQLLLDPNHVFMHPQSELLLFYADRLEHISGVISPALTRGDVVLVDRYVDSTYAYQCGGRGISDSIVQGLNALVGVMPTLTILLDLTVEEGLQRAKNRAGLDRFEQEDLAFHERVRNGYLEREKAEPNRIRRIACTGKNSHDVHHAVLEIVKEFGL